VRAKIAFISYVVVVTANSAIGTGRLARAQVVAFVRYHPHNTVGSHLNRFVVAGFDTGRVFALHAQRGQKVTRNFREFALVQVIHFSAKTPQRDFVFDLASHRASVAANATLYVERHFPAWCFPGVGVDESCCHYVFSLSN
jgi:hypothetical protein